MDNLIIGLIVVLALAYIGNKIYKQMSGQGGCGCGGGDSSKLKESSGC
ncbi:MAG: FeoB-associated Cys-rich membrane protein, partial [Veillonella sp.]|nr:FeoB-associated Cys-rich membrane protein [Veillonella sp.]